MTRVLVVDDREENLYFLEALLEGHGLAVERAPHGEEALRKARASPPDVVVSDLLMPIMDGYTLLKHWKADPVLRHIPFIVYTATYTEAQDQELALDLGADAFVVKPAEPEALLARINDMCERAAETREDRDPPPGEEEHAQVEAYNRVLVRKLEEKTLQLEEANRRLQVDLEERTRAKELLERSSALLRIAGRAAHLGGWSFRVGEPTVTWSDETCAIHDVPQGHTPSLEEVASYAVPRQRDALREAFDRCIRSGDPFDLEVLIETAEGRAVWIRTIGEPVRGDAGEVIGIRGAVQDVSLRKELEQRFLQAQRMESIAALTSGMAHDLNNVLAPILLAMELLQDEDVSEDVSGILETIEACANRGSEMVRQVLSFARGVDEPRARVDLQAVVDDAAKIVRDTFPASVTFIARAAEDLWPIEGDATQIHQVLMNSLVNARDAMPDGGTLAVDLDNVRVQESHPATSGRAEPGAYARVSVTDTGMGMSAEVLPRIFDPLYTTKPVGSGTGLGLSTVATVIQGHRGFVSVESEVGAGSTFRFHFPAVPEGRAREEGGTAHAALQGEGELVLVVDDEASVRTIAKQALEAFGYAVLTAEGGDDALARVKEREGAVDLVVIDLAMPDMDGAEVVRTLRGVVPEVPVVAVTGIGAARGEGPGDRPVADRYLSKPYTSEELLTVIGQLLRGR